MNNKQAKKEISQEIINLSNERPYKVLVRHESLPFKKIDLARRKAAANTIVKKVKNSIAKLTFNDNDKTFLNELKKENIIVMSNDIFDVFKVAKCLENNSESSKIISASFEKNLIDNDLISNIIKFESQKGLQSAFLSVISEVYKKILRLLLAKASEEKE